MISPRSCRACTHTTASSKTTHAATANPRAAAFPSPTRKSPLTPNTSIDTLRLNTYHILGFSDGGTAAYHLALNDERVQSVLTIGANWHSSQIEPARDMYENLTPDFLREHMPAQVAAYEQQNPQPDLVTLTADLRHLWLDNSTTGYPNERVAAIKQPILAVRGEDDFLLNLPDWAALREQNPAAHLLHIPFAGHEAIKAQPDILWAAIQTFHKP